ncbi:DUF72 domain-containing protein [Pollutibacter soli]|uniref:DUF72 domain-containing protein n=1 Tax=Pollutibacter soli TaxID=3034157 RepID=UPI003013EA3B
MSTGFDSGYFSRRYFSGTSGLLLPVPNKQFFPDEFEDRSRLTYYASLFNSIEVNSSFYKIPLGKTIANWSATVPDSFRFTFKLFREITHQKPAGTDKDLIRNFFAVIGNAGHKKGCLLVQFPAKTDFDIALLQELLFFISELNEEQHWRICVEFRDIKWYCNPVLSLLESLNISLVIHDKPKSITPISQLHNNTIYIRFHGPAGDYRGSYSTEILNQWAEKIFQWIQTGKTVFAYFNNTIGDAIQNLQTLNRLIDSRLAGMVQRQHQ